MGTMPEVYPHLIIDNFSGKIGERTASILKYLFPVPKPDSKRIVTFANRSDYISFRNYVYELRLYRIQLGTMEQKEAPTEWELRNFMRTSRKRDFLGD